MRWIWASARMILAHDLVQNNQSSPSPAAQSRINPAILFVIVILAAIFFVSGLLHLLVRFLSKSSPSSSREETLESEALQRQLQQLFHLHDSGLDQAFIDALPVFLYEDMIGEEDPFDCAVCLSEFSAGDKLRLLPVCSHAFHIACIDAWLLCNSTCPLCRATLFVPGQAIENPAFDLLDEDEDSEKRVFSVRLGKFRNVSEEREVEREEGETSSSCLGARRCYSMGSYQYVVGDPQLRVALTRRRKKTPREETSPENGKRIWAGSKDESFSVSKIWQWSNQKGKLPVAAGDCRDWNPAEGGRRVAVDL